MRFKINIVITILVSILLASCSKSKTIPDKKLVNILYDMYLLDAVTYNTGISNYDDSVRVYDPITEKYGYSVDDLNRTLRKHILKDGQLQKIFEKVNVKIAAEKKKWEPEARIEKLSQNQFRGTDSMVINSTVFSPRGFNVKLDEIGVYDVSAEFFFFEDDSTKNPKMTVWMSSQRHRDSVVNKQEISLEKDTVYKSYSLRITFDDPEFNLLKGNWVEYDQDTSKNIAKEIELKEVNIKQAKNTKPVRQPVKPLINKKVPIQHFKMKALNIKFNFDESDSTKMKGIIGPLPPIPGTPLGISEGERY